MVRHADHGQLSARAGFESFALATVTSARRLFVNDPSVADKVQAAWVEVGLLDAELISPRTRRQAQAWPGRRCARASGDPAQAGSTDQPATVAVCRSGGFAGTTKTGQLDLNSDPEGPEVRSADARRHRAHTSTRPAPDRFVYTVEYGDWRLTVPEQDLTPELRRLVQVVLNRGG